MKSRSVGAFVSVMIFLVFSFSARAQLGEALNNTNLTWTTGGTGGGTGWTSWNGTSHDGVASAKSSNTGSGKTSFLQTSVTGPGTLTFWCYAPSGFGTLSLSVGGITQASIAGTPSWVRQIVYIGSGTQIVKWTYSDSLFSGVCYVDEVSWVTGTTAPFITNQPPSQSQVQGLNNTFTVGALGTPPLYYQWHFKGIDIPGANSVSYTVTNVQTTNLSNYSVTITNMAGSTNSADASLEFGNVTAWGFSLFGQTFVPPGATNILAVSAGWEHSIALRNDRTLFAWGGASSGASTIPPNVSNVINISANNGNSTALNGDGTITEWGNGSYIQTNVISGLTNIVAISQGGSSSHSLVLASDGTVTAWGDNLSGDTNVPANLSNVVATAAGGSRSMALKSDGSVIAWGSDTSTPSSLTNAVAIAAGVFQSLALRSDGTVVGWGSGFGANVPAGLTNVVAIAAGVSHSLALKADGTVVAWGSNEAGQTNVPSGLTNVIAIAAGWSHNVVLVGDEPPILSAPLSNPIFSSNGFSFSVPSQSGRVYMLEYKNSLEDAAWTALPLMAGNGTDLTMTDSSATNSQRFYRVRRW